METKSKCEGCEYASGEHTCDERKVYSGTFITPLPIEENSDFEGLYELLVECEYHFQSGRTIEKLKDFIRTQKEISYQKGRDEIQEISENMVRTSTIAEIREANNQELIKLEKEKVLINEENAKGVSEIVKYVLDVKIQKIKDFINYLDTLK